MSLVRKSVWPLAIAAFVAIGIYRVFGTNVTCPRESVSIKACTETARGGTSGVEIHAGARGGVIELDESGLNPPFGLVGAGDASVAYASARLKITPLGPRHWRIETRVEATTSLAGLQLEGIDSGGASRIEPVSIPT